jgi:hypothetical protein
MTISQKVVTPVKTGVQMVCNCLKRLDSGFRRNDGKENFSTFYESIKNKYSFFSLKTMEDVIREIKDGNFRGMYYEKNKTDS